MRRIAALALTALLPVAVLGACGDDDDDGDTTTTTAGGGTTEATTTTTEPATTTTTAAGTTTTMAPGDLPGERTEIYPYEGAELGVVGVAADDVLNLRAAPGADQPQVATLDPLATGVVATGHNRTLDDGALWVEVENDSGTAWANGAFFAQLGTTDDITSQIAGGTLPTAETMLELGQLVADDRKSDDPPSRVIVVDEPTTGDLGEITVDVIGLADDAQLGERLHVFGTPGDEGFTLKSVEMTVLCGRGVTGDGLCV